MLSFFNHNAKVTISQPSNAVSFRPRKVLLWVKETMTIDMTSFHYQIKYTPNDNI